MRVNLTELTVLAVWVPPIAFLLAGVLTGLIAERAILVRAERHAARRQWAGKELVLSALRGVVLVWCVVAGAYGALLSAPPAPAWSRVSEKLLLVVVIASATLVIARIAGDTVSLYSRRLSRDGRGTALLSPSIVTNLTELSVALVGVLITLQSLGIAITPILTALGVGGLAVALALQETLSNLFSGLYIITARQIRPGDYVRLNTGEEGYVTDITWRNAKLREGPNNMIIVPNAKLASATVTNYYQPDREITMPVQVSVSYDSDLAAVERTTLAVARQVLRDVPGSVRAFDPVLRFHTFAEAGVGFTVVLRAQEVSRRDLLKHEFIKRLHARYREEGVRFHSHPGVWVSAEEEGRFAVRRHPRVP